MKILIVACAFAIAFGVSSTAAAQYPAKPIRLIMPFPAGAAADTVARIVAQPLSQVLGQPVLVDPLCSTESGTPPLCLRIHLISHKRPNHPFNADEPQAARWLTERLAP